MSLEAAADLACRAVLERGPSMPDAVLIRMHGIDPDTVDFGNAIGLLFAIQRGHLKIADEGLIRARLGGEE